MPKFADEVIRPIVRAADDVPVHGRQLGDMVRGFKTKQRGNRDGVEEIDVYEGGPSTPRKPSGRNDGRDERGRFVGDGNRPWVDRERIGLDNVADDLGVTIRRDQVASRHPSTGDQRRFFDGLFQNADGTWTGVEVKSGSASRNPAQRFFDEAISVDTPAIANLPGVGPVRVVRVILEEVP